MEAVFSSGLESCSTFRNRENRSKSLAEYIEMNLLTYREQLDSAKEAIQNLMKLS
jgi:hypothetical protein